MLLRDWRGWQSLRWQDGRSSSRRTEQKHPDVGSNTCVTWVLSGNHRTSSTCGEKVWLARRSPRVGQGDGSLPQTGVWPLDTAHMLNMFSRSKSNGTPPLPSFLHHHSKNHGKISVPQPETLRKQGLGAPTYQQKLLRANPSLLTDFREWLKQQSRFISFP